MILGKKNEGQNNFYLFQRRTIRKAKGEGRVGRVAGYRKFSFHELFCDPALPHA